MTSQPKATAAPRPALRRATDADIHPALAVLPAKEAMPIRRPAVVPELVVTQTEVVAPGKAARKGKKKSKPSSQEQAKGGKRYTGAGKATSDAVRQVDQKPGKPVDLGVKVPKTLRKELRRVAKLSGETPDKLVAEALATWLGDPRRI